MSEIRVYSKPGCPNCKKLKEWLSSRDFRFKDVTMTTDVSTDLIMRNIFSDPPILEAVTDGHVDALFGSKRIFKDQEFNPLFLSGMEYWRK